MKKITYALILIASLSIIGCNDYNVITPTVTAAPGVNTPWDLVVERKPDPQRFDLWTNPFSYNIVLSGNNKLLVVEHNYNTDSKAEIVATSNVFTNITNGAKELHLTYHDTTQNNVPINLAKGWSNKHFFKVINQGIGTNASIPVKVFYKKNSPAMPVPNPENYVLTF